MSRRVLSVLAGAAFLWCCSSRTPSPAAEAGSGGATRLAPIEAAGASGMVQTTVQTPPPRTDAGAPHAGSGGVSGSAPDAGAAGAAGVAGAAGAPLDEDAGSAPAMPTFAIGADITWVQADEARGATYSDGTRKDILRLLRDHGFNYIRLRTFVDPRASDGYDRTGGFGDLAHTIEFGKRVKSAQMGLLVDFHYSDNWADPGKQCVPVAWQQHTSIGALAGAVHDYTKDAISRLIAVGARPDMVQIGNEITPGMLLHRCDAAGKPTGSNPVSGSSSNWANLGQLLKAASQAVKAVDPDILVMIHIDRGDDFATSRDFIRNALDSGVTFEVFGESCYTAYQGRPQAWRSTFTQLAAQFPKLKFVIAEYGPEQRAANDVMFELPDERGLGTFNWEPTHGGAWNTGHELFSVSGNAYTATRDLMLYDSMVTAYESRLR